MTQEALKKKTSCESTCAEKESWKGPELARFHRSATVMNTEVSVSGCVLMLMRADVTQSGSPGMLQIRVNTEHRSSSPLTATFELTGQFKSPHLTLTVTPASVPLLNRMTALSPLDKFLYQTCEKPVPAGVGVTLTREPPLTSSSWSMAITCQCQAHVKFAMGLGHMVFLVRA